MYKNGKTRNNNFFKCEIETESGSNITLEVYPPKLSVYRKMENLNDKSSVEEIAQLVSQILSKNKSKTEITSDFVLDNMDMADIMDFFDDFAEWLSGTRTEKN